MAHCKNCGEMVVGQFCAECGTSKGVGNNFCAGCGGKNDKPDWKFCVHCGEKNASGAPPPSATCACGVAYLAGSRFCASCGEPRPGLTGSGGMPESSGSAPPGLPKRRAVPPPPLPGGRSPLSTSGEVPGNISPRSNNSGYNMSGSTSPRSANSGYNAPPQRVEVSAPQTWSPPPRPAPTAPMNITSTPATPTYTSAPSQYAIPAAPPEPQVKEKKKKSLKEKLKSKLVGGGWLIDKNAPPKTATSPDKSSPKPVKSTDPRPIPTTNTASSGSTNSRILEHIQKSYEPAPGSSPQMGSSPRTISPMASPSPPTHTAAMSTSPSTRPVVTPPPPPPKTTPAPSAERAPKTTDPALVPKKEGDVVLVGTSFGKQPAAKPIQKVHVPAPPPGIKNKDNRMSLNTILAESTNFDGSASYQATIVSHEERADAVDTSKKVTLFKIAVAQNGKSWAVFRRVAQFEELDKRLKKKGVLGPNDGSLKKKAKDKDQMLQDLERYLVYLLSNSESASHHYLHNFLQPTQLGDVKAT